MASITRSANQSTASLFDVVGDVTTAASKSLTTLSRGIDMLDAKAKAMHQSVLEQAAIDMATSQQRSIENAAQEATERQEDLAKWLTDGGKDRANLYQKNIALFQKALQDAASTST